MDRVIHNRGQVSEENREKIQGIIDEMNFKPNLLARSLASKRNYLIVSLFPESKSDSSYWDAPINGIRKAWKEIADYNVTVKNLYFNQYKVESFIERTNELLQLHPDAVLMAPVFKKETIEFAGTLFAQKIPYIFIDSNIEGLANLTYYGQHSYQSGYLAARLLELGLPEKSNIGIFKPSGANISNQVRSRESGFRAFFERESLKDRYHFLSFDYTVKNEVEREKQLHSFFTEKAPIAAAVVFNSRVHEIASFLERYKIKNVRLIGYDLLPENAEYLRKGFVSFLIAQHPEEQGYRGIITLFDYLVLKREVSKVQYAPIDILTKENLDYYINFK